MTNLYAYIYHIFVNIEVQREREREREREGFIRSICVIFKNWDQPENVVIFSILLLK